jgi:hypothetical protein
MTPSEILRRFFSSYAPEQRDWLTLSCARQIDRDVVCFQTTEEGDRWLATFLSEAAEPDPMRRFGRAIWLIAILDFELSPFALSRLEAKHRHVMESSRADGAENLAKMSEGFLRERLPRFQKMASAWKETRANELDEASLWIFRDEMKDLAWDETSRQLRSIVWPSPPPTPD